MPRKPKAVPLSKVDDIQASLKQKASTPKTISLEELIKSLAKPIQDMLDAGYSYEDVSDVFKGHGVELAASGIKTFHKRALTTTILQQSNESLVESDFSSNNDLITTGETSSAVESNKDSGSSPDTASTSGASPSQSAKGKKGGAKAHSQFNVTDRSSL